MSTVTKKENVIDQSGKINASHVLSLSALLANCTNVPLADLNEFINYLELKEKIKETAGEIEKLHISILESYGLTSNNGTYDFTGHEKQKEIEDALVKLTEKEYFIPGLKSLTIGLVEFAQMTTGLKNFQVEFIRSWLTKRYM